MTKEQAIEQNRGLVYKVAKRYKNSKVEFLDLVQAGYLGILDAYEHYSEDKAKENGNTFYTYAFYWVKKRIQEEATNVHLVKIPVNIQSTRNSIYKAEASYEALFGKEPDEYSLATMLDMGVEEISKTNFRCDVEFFSDVNNVPAPNQEISLDPKFSTFVENLSYNETFVLVCREHNLTLEETGRRLGSALGKRALSRERIRQIEEQALNIIKRRIKIRKKQALYG